MRRKKPDLIVVLAVLIGLGMLVTEVTYGEVFAPQLQKAKVSR